MSNGFVVTSKYEIKTIQKELRRLPNVIFLPSYHIQYLVAYATHFYLFLFHTWVLERVHRTHISLLGVCVVDGLEDDWKLVCRGDEFL